MKTTKQKIIGKFTRWQSVTWIITVFWFALGAYAFSGPIAGCTPGSCPAPLKQDFATQRVWVGTENPQITLDVEWGVRIGQLSTVNINQITCDADTLGTLIFDTDEDLVKVCTSVGWGPLE